MTEPKIPATDAERVQAFIDSYREDDDSELVDQARAYVYLTIGDLRGIMAERDELRERAERTATPIRDAGSYRIAGYATVAYGEPVARVEVGHEPCCTVVYDEGRNGADPLGRPLDAAHLLSLMAAHHCGGTAVQPSTTNGA